MTTVRDRNIEKASMSAFFAGRSVLITGGTGFLGKVLIEKILRSCPEVREIFLLIRPKKGKSVDDRLRDILQLPLFDQLRERNPSALEKLIPVRGDVSLEGLGLEDVERRFLIERVSIVFNVAANVRFDEDLKKDILINTRSTRDICILAGSMKNLVVLLHVSTAYAHANMPVVEEVIYPSDVDWKKTIKIVEGLDEQTVRTFSSKYLGAMPNTYTFSKKLAEQVIYDYGRHLPCVIFRPSIVVSTVEDPIVGWLDNFNGPVGLMVGGGKGVIRVVYSNPHAYADFMPVDLAIKAILLTARERGTQTITKDNEVYVYNCCSNGIKCVSLGQLVKMGIRIAKEIPLEGIIWHPSTVMTNNLLLYYLMLIFCHIVPAIVIDTMLKFSGRRPILFNIQRKVYASTRELSYFLLHEWTFRNDKLLKVLNKLPANDRKEFHFVYDDFDISKYFQNCLIGAKKFLLHEDMSNLKQAKLHYNRMWWLEKITIAFGGILLVWILAKTGAFLYLLQMIESVVNTKAFAV